MALSRLHKPTETIQVLQKRSGFSLRRRWLIKCGSRKSASVGQWKVQMKRSVETFRWNEAAWSSPANVSLVFLIRLVSFRKLLIQKFWAEFFSFGSIVHSCFSVLNSQESAFEPLERSVSPIRKSLDQPFRQFHQPALDCVLEFAQKVVHKLQSLCELSIDHHSREFDQTSILFSRISVHSDNKSTNLKWFRTQVTCLILVY